MSTRANIIIKDQDDELIFYRHSDGYPKGTMPTLEKFLRYVKEGRIRNNVEQAAGWLIVIGRDEYRESHDNDGRVNEFNGNEPLPEDTGYSWKVGAYEPSTCMHGDIEYLYVVDLDKLTIEHSETGRDGEYNATVPYSFYSGQFNRPKYKALQG